MRTSLRSRTIAVLTLACLAGCSVVNSLDELKEPNDGKFTGETRPVETVSIDDAGFGPSSPPDAGGSDANNGQPFQPLVVGGEGNLGDSGLAPVLTVLDSKTGQERGQRERMWVAGIAHDPLRDLWYIFEGTNYFIIPATETVKVHVRKLDSTTGAWSEQGVYEGPPLAYYDAIAVTRERVTYVAHPADPAAAGAKYRLVTVNTSDVTHPGLNAETELTTGGLPRGITGTPSVLGPGGSVNVMYVASGADCADGGAECPARIVRFLLPNGSTPSKLGEKLVGGIAKQTVPGFGSLGCGGDDVLVMPNVANDGTQILGTYSVAESEETGTQAFKMVKGASLLRRLGVDEAHKMVFVVEANTDTKLYAVNVGGAALPGVNLGHSGQSVYYDPSSSTAFAPFNQGEGKTFSPYRVAADGKSLVERTPKTADNAAGDWNPPDDLRPNVLGIRRSATCQ